MRNQYLVSDGGMGGFADPPGYPTHQYSIYDGPRQNPHAISCIESALTDPSWFSPEITRQVRILIGGWYINRPALDSPEVQAWIGLCLRHWQSCYVSPRTDSTSIGIYYAKDGPLPPIDLHFGVRQIRKFYPEYEVSEAAAR